MRSAFLWRPYCKVTSILILLAEWASWSVSAQIRTVTLPEAPAMQSAEAALSAPAGSASISGQVTDLSGAAVPSAHVTLTNNGTVIQTATAGDRGQFRLEGLATGFYRVNVTAAGMGTYVSARFHLDAAEALKLTDIQLAVGATRADVEVTVTEQQVAEEQVKEEEKQRALGILPNFYSSYTWNAAPLPAKQKFSLAFHSLLDPFAFVGVGVAAGAEQAGNTYPGYGQGAAGYGKRYGAAYADQASARLLGSALYPVLFRQDPRYFYLGSGTVRERTFYAISRVFVTRGDTGHSQPNYSYVLGAFSSAGLANLYHPSGDRGLGLVISNGFIALGGHAADELLREFLLRRLTPRVPDYEQGKPRTAPRP